MKKHFATLGLFAMAAALAASASAAENNAGTPAVRVIDVAKVWSGHPVGFCLLTHGDQQFAAYYDENRRMTVAQRALNSDAWRYTRLDSTAGWDSHNYITMAVDSAGYLHLSGNMHVMPLVYFRSTKPLDASTLQRVPKMVGSRESHVTYPVFLDGPGGKLIFYYRDGASGNGDNLFNVYDAANQTWKRLLDTPLMSGLNESRGVHARPGTRNAYMNKPLLGPDGYYHVVWVWRDTPAAETCHDLSYIRSKDLVHWENIRGEPLSLPIVIGDNAKVVIDPIPSRGGILNGSPKMSFLKDGSLAVVYPKYDAAGNTQLYVATPSGKSWKITQMTHWDCRWDFQGGGSLPSGDVASSSLEEAGGKLVLGVSHKKYGHGLWEVDRKTFQLLRKTADPRPQFVMPKELRVPISKFPGMRVKQAADEGKTNNGKEYRLRWETLDANRDRPRPQPWPEPTMLQVIEWTR